MRGYISGATGYLGRMLSFHFINQNHSLTLAGRDMDALRELRDQLLDRAIDPCVSIDIHQLDFSDPSSISRQLMDVNGESFDWCINAIGEQGSISPDIRLKYSEYQRTLGINLLSPIEFTRHFSKCFLEKKHGKIIHFLGGGSSNPRPYFSPYAISKTALARYVENTALELQRDNIQIFSVSPGLMPSKMLRDSISCPEFLQKTEIDAVIESLDGIMEYDGSKILRLIDFLLSDSAKFCSGKMISAQWDNWSEWPNHLDEIINSDLYTLRRITGRDRDKNWGDVK
jgi:short-subunit dehydrogenase